MGPILFNLYTAPLEEILVRHDIDFMLYADDTQLYMVCVISLTMLVMLLINVFKKYVIG